jgi:poly(A) polymerase
VPKTKTAKIYHAKRHRIPTDRIDTDALRILSTLRQAGFLAYLVGGSVRDLLIGRTPKDYDISTSAQPEEIKATFRNCLLIGKRFRLAHVRIGRKIFEVSTFRSGNITDDNLIVRDNQWGSSEEDALRRDFTINGLFYNSEDNTVIDYVNAWDDIQSGTLKCIGEPVARFKQDPVRMLRLIKFQARFKLHVNSQTAEALELCKKEITKSAPARVLEEIFRLLESGYSAEGFHLLQEYGLLPHLFSGISKFLKKDRGNKIISLLDAANKTIVPVKSNPFPLRPVFFSCLLFPMLEHQLQVNFVDKGKTPNLGQIQDEIYELIQQVVDSFPLFPKKLRSSVTFILLTQYRLTPFSNKKKVRLYRLMRNSDFSLALRFLKIRAFINTELQTKYARWKKIYFQTN